MLDDIRKQIAFLTRIPTRIEIKSLEEIARKMWLFPFVGFLIGTLAGILNWVLTFILPDFIRGFAILAFLLWITGGHHTDGLLDLGDGLMAHGDPEKKIKIMHDVSTGTGGFIIGFIILGLTAFTIAEISSFSILIFITAELGAKWAMHIACVYGKNTSTPMAESFIRLNTPRSLIYSSLLTITLFGIAFFIQFGIHPEYQYIVFLIILLLVLTPLSAFTMIIVSNHHFNGLTGDCLGALNEITRVVLFLGIIISEQIGLIV
jgi:adenosylcobinamide-GDP ribazoletransferase